MRISKLLSTLAFCFLGITGPLSAQQQPFPGGGISPVSSLPATCTPGTSSQVAISVSITVGGITYGAGTVFYCDSLNHYSPVSQGSGASPIIGYYLSPQCPPSNAALCFNTPANTQQSNLCTYTNTSAVVTCQTQMINATAAVAANVATYTFPAPVVPSWAIGNSINVTLFTVADAFFNQTCTLTAVAANSVSCALVHANASSTTLGTVQNASAGPFTAFDAGTGNPYGAKRIFGYNSCQTDQSFSGSNQAMTATPLTISTFNSSSQITMSGTATGGSGANAGCVIWGNTDDAGAAAMDSAMLAAPQCPRAHLAAAYYLFTVPHFYNQPFACTQTGANSNNAYRSAGNLTYAAGFELDGRGAGTTVIYLPTGFPETGTCANGLSKVGCFVVPVEARFSNFQITGGGNFTTANFTSGKNLVELDGPATLDYFTCTNFGFGTAGTVGIGIYGHSQITFINSSGCGDTAIETANGWSAATGMRVIVENQGTFGFLIGGLADYVTFQVPEYSKYDFICYDCWSYNPGALNTAVATMRILNGRAVKLYHMRVGPFVSGLAVNGLVGIQTLGTAGAKMDIQDSYIDMSAAGVATGTGNKGINCVAACTVTIKNSIVKGTTGGSAYSDVAGSKFLSEGGNQLGAMSVNAGSLLLLNPTDDLSSATGVAPTCTFTSGGGTAPSCALQTGSTNESGVIIATTGTGAPGSTGTVTLNLLGTYTLSASAPSCKFTLDNSGTAWGAEAVVFVNAQSTTAPVLAWTNINSIALAALTVSSPYRVDYTCTARL